MGLSDELLQLKYDLNKCIFPKNKFYVVSCIRTDILGLGF